MVYVPFKLRLYDAIYSALAANLSAELESVGQDPVSPEAFAIRFPTSIEGETIALLYRSTDRRTQAQHWIDAQYKFDLELYAYDVDATATNRRLMYFEWASVQVLQKNKTMGGLLRGLAVGEGDPMPGIRRPTREICAGLSLPIVCEPAERIAVPELAAPGGVA